MTTTQALLDSLQRGPLLVGNLPESSTFPFQNLTIPPGHPNLNLQQKLGHLYEDALALLLDHSDQFDLVAQNLQIQKDAHTTVGELDYLIRDLASDDLIHLELATKFYLAVETDSGLTLPGPDARDNYFRKLARLRTHQLQLPKLFRDHLPEKFRDQPIITEQLIYGCLFDHIDSTTPASPEFINPSCRRGKWLTIDELPSHFSGKTVFQMIPKPLWPAPLEALNTIPLELWSPETAVDRCLMVKVNDEPLPYFIAPTGFPTHRP